MVVSRLESLPMMVMTMMYLVELSWQMRRKGFNDVGSWELLK